MNSAADHAREAYLAGVLLALGIQKLKLLPSTQFEKLRLHVRDSLRKMDVSPDLVDLEQFKSLSADEAVPVVIDMKSALETAIRKGSGDFASGLFLLTFDFMLVSTNPQSVSELDSDFVPRAVELGFERGPFEKTLARLATDPDGAVAEYEKSAEVVISKRAKRSNRARRDAVREPHANETRGAISVVIALLAAVGGLTLVLGLVWKMTESTVALVAISITAVLVLVLVLAYVAASTHILRGTQLERVLLGVLDKVSVLAALVGRRKKDPPMNGR